MIHFWQEMSCTRAVDKSVALWFAQLNQKYQSVLTCWDCQSRFPTSCRQSLVNRKISMPSTENHTEVEVDKDIPCLFMKVCPMVSSYHHSKAEWRAATAG